jgi:hypothetical protein
MPACALLWLTVAAVAAAAQPPAHAIEFWRSIAQHDYVLPSGSDLPALTAELEEYLASPDPERRDEIAYSTLTAWIYGKRLIGPDLLRPLTDRLVANLKQGIGQRDSDTVFKRSFSALVLSVVAARDNAAPYMTAAEFRRLEDAALAYLAAEKDLRGYDARTGWMHSAAHTADLLKFLARSRFLEPPDQRRLLDAVAAKLSSAPTVFTHGEDERFARTVLSIVNRSDFDRSAFKEWASATRPGRLEAERPTAAELNSRQNVKNLPSKLEVLLALEAQPSESIQYAREAVRAALKDLF